MSAFACEHCDCAFDEGNDLRNHYRFYHGIKVTRESLVFWPDLGLPELARLTFWHTMMLDGYAWAMETREGVEMAA